MDSRIIPNTSPTVHRTPLPPDVPIPPESFDSTLESFLHHVTLFPDAPCLGTRPTSTSPYVYETYTQIKKQVENLAGSLGGYKGDNVCILLGNGPEFHITSLACQGTHKTLVPLYPTLGPSSITHIINETSPACVISSTYLLQHLPLNLTCPILTVGSTAGITSNFNLIPLTRLTSTTSSTPLSLPNPNSTHTICYTSGTTGNPKGCIITYLNIKSVLTSMLSHLPLPLGPSDVHFSYLPLAHVFERIVCEGVLSCGGRIGYVRFNCDAKVQGSYLMEDLRECRPTIFTAAPRVLEKIKNGVENKFGNVKGFMKRVINRAMNVKGLNLEKYGNPDSGLYDKLIFNKIKIGVGLDKCKVIISGSAPLLPSTYKFIRILLPGLEILEGYGLTESTGGVSVTKFGRGREGVVGSVIPCCEVRLSTRDGFKGGEIEVRGSNIIQGYYQKDAPPIKITDDEGWFRTGDIGEWDEFGGLKITDRIKNTFKLQQGEFVSVEKIEGVVRSVPGVDMAVIYGDGTRNCLVCLVTLETPIKPDILLSKIKETCVSEKLKGFEIPKSVRIVEEFSVGNGCVTPTFKVVRKGVKKLFGGVIEEMYREVEGEKRSRL